MLLLPALVLAWPVTANAQPDLAPGSDTECVRGGSCLVDVTIENLGDTAFDGAAGLRGVFDPTVTVESVSAETGKLKCDMTAEGAYECLGAALTVGPGESAGIQVVIDIPAGFAAKTITHTNEIVWPEEADKNANTENDRHVSAITVIDPAMLPAVDLAVANTALEDACAAGKPCGFALTVTNNGPAAYDGTILIRDSTDLQGTELLSATPSEWSCEETKDHITCSLANTMLPPGETRSLVLTLNTASFLRGTLTNCAEVSRGTKILVRDIQRALNEAGYNAGLVDGIAGRRTRAAIAAFQEENGLAATGEIGAELVDKLLGDEKSGDTAPDNDRACANVQVIAPADVEPAAPQDPPAGAGEQDTGQ